MLPAILFLTVVLLVSFDVPQYFFNYMGTVQVLETNPIDLEKHDEVFG